MHHKKKVILAVSLLLLLLITFGVFASCAVFAPLYRAPQVEGEDPATTLFVYPYDGWDEVEERVADGGSSPLIEFGMRLLGTVLPARLPRAGAYALRDKSSAYDIFRVIAGGRQTPIKLTFTSRRLPEELWTVLSDQLLIDSASVAKAMTDTLLLRSLGVMDSTMAYHLIPNTYEVYWTISAEDLVRRMDKEYRAFWTPSRERKAEALGLSKSEVSILASIVSEESSHVDEYPMIAGLYLNRLKRGMPLQADPTVKFALGDFGLRRILLEHLSVDSPYNTYRVQGLPPGPIRIPSPQSIDGVLNTTKHNYLYMVARADFSGYHDFSESYAEHTRKAALYRRALNERGIK